MNTNTIPEETIIAQAKVIALEEINRERAERDMRPIPELSHVTWERRQAEFIAKARAVSEPALILASIRASIRK